MFVGRSLGRLFIKTGCIVDKQTTISQRSSTIKVQDNCIVMVSCQNCQSTLMVFGLDLTTHRYSRTLRGVQSTHSRMIYLRNVETYWIDVTNQAMPAATIPSVIITNCYHPSSQTLLLQLEEAIAVYLAVSTSHVMPGSRRCVLSRAGSPTSSAARVFESGGLYRSEIG